MNSVASDLKKLSNEELFRRAKLCVKDETNSTLKVLYALREIEHRRAFSEKHYPSLFEFCVDFLGYKKGAAYRRIVAMRALKEMPEIEEKVQNGTIDLMTLSQAQGYFNQKKRNHEPLGIETKKEIIASLENKSTRETEEFFLELSPKEPIKERIKATSVETFSLQLSMPKRVKEKLDYLRTLMASEKASVKTLEVLEAALDEGIKAYEKKLSTSAKKVPALEQKKTISIHVRREVWRRDQGQCTFVDPVTKLRRQEKRYLEYDHIHPKSLSGSNEIENIRLLCRSHNQMAAMHVFGRRKMEKYWQRT